MEREKGKRAQLEFDSSLQAALLSSLTFTFLQNNKEREKARFYPRPILLLKPSETRAPLIPPTSPPTQHSPSFTLSLSSHPHSRRRKAQLSPLSQQTEHSFTPSRASQFVSAARIEWDASRRTREAVSAQWRPWRLFPGP